MRIFKTIFLIIIVFQLTACSVYNKYTKTKDVFFLIGSGFNHEIVKIYFNNYEFQFEATTDLSSGIDLSHNFQCSNKIIKLIKNDTVVDSTVVNSCKTINLKIVSKTSKLESDISTSKGRYIIIHKNKTNGDLLIFQSKTPFLLE